MLFDKKPELKSMNSDVSAFKEYKTHEDFAHRLGFLHTDTKRRNADIAHLRSHDSEQQSQEPVSSENAGANCGNTHANHYREILERHLHH